jgi:hypothetical protein
VLPDAVFTVAGDAVADLSGIFPPVAGSAEPPWTVRLVLDIPTTDDGIVIAGASEKVKGIVDGDGHEGIWRT